MNTRLAALGAGIGLGLAGGAALRGRAETDIRDKVALVTGSSRGFGFVLARALAREGCCLVICARDTHELERARDGLAQQGAEVLAIPCDVAERGQVENMVRQAIARFGRIDILVNNAGIIQVGPYRAMSDDDYRQAMNIIFWGAYNTTMAVLPEMRRRGEGRIVNITSIGGKVSVPHLLPYSAAKFAAVGFSEGLRAEVAREGISVTTIVPGLMRTGSPLNVTIKGRSRWEYLWFALGDSLPFVSMDAERAARQTISAMKHGEAERVLSLPAIMLSRVHGLAPGLTANLLGVVNRLLPQADGETNETRRGMEVQREVQSPALDALMGLSLSAAKRFHQYDAPPDGHAGAAGRSQTVSS